MVSHRHIKNLMGRQVYCHTHFGTFKGVIIHTTKHHIVLGAVHEVNRPVPASWESRPFGMGPGGPAGPGGPGGPAGPGGGHGGPGWGLAVPLAAILGITAVGMHWW